MPVGFLAPAWGINLPVMTWITLQVRVLDGAGRPIAAGVKWSADYMNHVSNQPRFDVNPSTSGPDGLCTTRIWVDQAADDSSDVTVRIHADAGQYGIAAMGLDFQSKIFSNQFGRVVFYYPPADEYIPKNQNTTIGGKIYALPGHPVGNLPLDLFYEENTFRGAKIVSPVTTDGDGNFSSTLWLPPDFWIDFVRVDARSGDYIYGITPDWRVGTPPPPGANGQITVVPVETPPLSYGQWHDVKATYTAHDGSPNKNRQLVWNSNYPSQNIHYSATGISTTGDDGTSIIQVRAEQPTSGVILGAWSPDPNVASGRDEGHSAPIDFIDPTTQPSNTLVFEAPPGAAVLPVDVKQEVRVRYTSNASGTGISGGTIQWGPDPLPRGLYWSDNSPPTDSNGETSRHIIAQPPFGQPYDQPVTLTATVVGTKDAAARGVEFDATAGHGGGGPGQIIIKSSDGDADLSEGQPHLLTASYTLADGSAADGVQLTWSTSPNDPRISFLPNPSPVSKGASATRVTATADVNLPGIVVVATSPNPNGENGSDGAIHTLSFIVSAPAANVLAFEAPPAGAVLPVDVPQEVRVRYATSAAVGIAGKTIQWSPDPLPQYLSWSDQSATTDANGEASRHIIAQPPFGHVFDQAVTLTATIAGTKDTAQRGVEFNATTGHGGGGPGRIVITSPDGDGNLSEGSPHPLAAVYTLADGTAADGVQLTWSTAPNDPRIRFQPNPSPVGKGASTTKITATANVDLPGITVVAASPNPNAPGGSDSAIRELSFVASASSTNSLIFEAPPAGAILPVNVLQEVRVRYTNSAGVGIAGKTVQWGPDPLPPHLDWNDQSAATDSNGEASRHIIAQPIFGQPFDQPVALTAVIAGTKDAAQRTIEFDATRGGGPGQITITSPDGDSKLSEGKPHPLNAVYQRADGSAADGVQLTWSTASNDPRITFQPNPSPVGKGASTTNITATADVDLPSVSVTAQSPNPNAPGHHDRGTRQLGFVASGSGTLLGVSVTRVYAHAPGLDGDVDPSDSDKTLTATLVLTDPQGAPVKGVPIGLAANPSGAGVELFTATNQPLAPGQTVTTGQDGKAAVKAASANWAIFDLVASWQQIQGKTELVIGTVSDDYADLDKPRISQMGTGGPLLIPAVRPAPTFTLVVPPQESRNPPLGGSSQLAIWLNERVVRVGTVQEGYDGIEIAYAALSTTSQNSLAYVVQGRNNIARQSYVLRFSATGKAQTGPDAGSAPRPLPPPILAGGATALGTADIMRGMAIQVPANPSFAPADVLTAFAYLSGKEPGSGQPIWNIVPIVYPVQAGDFANGAPLLLTLPQFTLVGYGQGTVCMDYSVYKPATGAATFSQVSPTLNLNTAT